MTTKSSNIESVLREAARSRLGPLHLTFSSEGKDSWSLKVDFAGLASSDVRLVYEPEAAALRLERQYPGSVSREALSELVRSRPWLLEAAPTAGEGVAARLWLHASGLTPNLVLQAAAEMARIESVLGGSASPATVSEPKVTEKPSPILEEIAEAPAAAEAKAEPAWQSLGAPVPLRAISGSPHEVAAGPLPSMQEHQQPPDSAPVGNCRECGAPYKRDHVFCMNCGARLN
jgi:hypothetical protein